MTIYSIERVSEYLEILNKLDELYIYRGQPKDWPLIPKIGRQTMEDLGYGDWQILERSILDDFINDATLILEKEPKRFIDWLILSQNYGLPTRLLDWTRNPLKALFFACIDNYEDDGFVYLLSFNSWFSDSIDFEYKIRDDNLDIFYPKINNERMLLQEGCFTVYPLKKDAKDLVEINKNNFPKDILDVEKIKIPATLKKSILHQLNYLGINHKFIFSGVEGICKKICHELGY